MEYNLSKLWITILYTCNLYNIVHQLYFNQNKVTEPKPIKEGEKYVKIKKKVLDWSL